MSQSTDHGKQERGFVLISTVVLLGASLMIGASLLTAMNTNLVDGAIHRDEVQALYLAETGTEEAIWYLQNIDVNWAGDFPTEHTLMNGTYVIVVDHSAPPTIVIRSTGYVPDMANPRVQKTVEVRGTLS